MNPENTILLRVVTPHGAIMEEPTSSVAIWTALGEIEVLPGHEPTVVLLEPGELRARLAKDGSERVLAAGEGFARIDQRSVTIFSDMAQDAEGITMEAEEAAKARAESALADARNMTDDERNAADLALRESLAKIQILLRRKGQHPR
jgi:F-type H+-transporting ATPase subunit epsilon